MPAIDDLGASGTLEFDSISNQLHVSAPGAGDSDVTIPGFCVTNPHAPEPDALAFELDPALLALPIASQPFLFTGTPNGNQGTWRIGQPLDVRYGGAHLSRVHGKIVTRVDNVTPSFGTDCRGAQRVQTMTLTTVGTANAVRIDTDPDAGSAAIRGATPALVSGCPFCCEQTRQSGPPGRRRSW